MNVWPSRKKNENQEISWRDTEHYITRQAKQVLPAWNIPTKEEVILEEGLGWFLNLCQDKLS